jgi:hypothetical protein
MRDTSHVAPGTKVWRVIQKYPFTFEVFRNHGCPDMRHGIFKMMAHLMSVERAAKMHRIAPEVLIADLNAAIARAEQTSSDTA